MKSVRKSSRAPAVTKLPSFGDLCEMSGGLAVIWRRNGCTEREMLEFINDDTGMEFVLCFGKAGMVNMRRLIARATDSMEAIEERVAKAAEEMTYAPQFDKILINDNLDDAFARAEEMVDEFLK